MEKFHSSFGFSSWVLFPTPCWNKYRSCSLGLAVKFKNINNLQLAIRGFSSLWLNVSVQFCLCLAMYPIGPDPDSWDWFLRFTSNLPHHSVLTGWSLGRGHHHWTWSWLLFTVWPWTCLFPMVLPNDLDLWGPWSPFSCQSCLGWWGWASAITVSVLLWYLGHHLLESSWVFLLPSRTVTVCHAAVHYFVWSPSNLLDIEHFKGQN